LNPVLLTSGSIAAMLRAVAFIGLIAVGQTLLMVAGEIDLSVGSVAGLCAVVSGWLMVKLHWPVAPSLAAGLCAGAAAGLINGLLAVRVGLPAFIATLGMLYMARGITYAICSGYPLYPLPASLTRFGKMSPLGISCAFFVFLVLAIIGDFILRRTVFGRSVCATGGNAEVARIAGIRAGGVKLACYVLTGTLAGLAGILMAAQVGVAQPDFGTGWELDVIAAVVIGGVSLFGGVGTVRGPVLGLLLLQVVRSGLITSGVNTYWQTATVGFIIVAAVSVDILRRRTKPG
ncbi:MAG: ABC transporter permease, partial [Tepidisphaeraceae bacterium]